MRTCNTADASHIIGSVRAHMWPQAVTNQVQAWGLQSELSLQELDEPVGQISLAYTHHLF